MSIRLAGPVIILPCPCCDVNPRPHHGYGRLFLICHTCWRNASGVNAFFAAKEWNETAASVAPHIKWLRERFDYEALDRATRQTAPVL